MMRNNSLPNSFRQQNDNKFQQPSVNYFPPQQIPQTNSKQNAFLKSFTNIPTPQIKNQSPPRVRIKQLGSNSKISTPPRTMVNSRLVSNQSESTLKPIENKQIPMTSVIKQQVPVYIMNQGAQIQEKNIEFLEQTGEFFNKENQEGLYKNRKNPMNEQQYFQKDQEMEKCQSKVQMLTQELEKINISYKLFHEQYESEIKQFREKLTYCQLESEQYKKQYQEKDNQVISLENKVALLSTEIHHQMASLNHKQEELQTLQADKENLQRRNKELENKMYDLSSNLEKLNILLMQEKSENEKREETHQKSIQKVNQQFEFQIKNLEISHLQEVQTLKNEYIIVKQKMQSFSQEKEKYSFENSSLKTQIESMKQEIEKKNLYSDKLRECEFNNAQLRSKMDELILIIEEKEKKVVEQSLHFNDKVHQLQNEFSQEKKELKNKIEELVLQLNEQNNEGIKKSMKINDITNEKNFILKKAQTFEQENCSLKTKTEQLLTQLNNLNSLIEQKEQTIKQFSVYKDEVMLLTDQLDQKKQQLQEFNDLIEIRNREIQQWQEKCIILEDQSQGQFSLRLGEKEQEINKMKQQLAKLQKENIDLKNYVEFENRKIQEIEESKGRDYHIKEKQIDILLNQKQDMLMHIVFMGSLIESLNNQKKNTSEYTNNGSSVIRTAVEVRRNSLVSKEPYIKKNSFQQQPSSVFSSQYLFKSPVVSNARFGQTMDIQQNSQKNEADMMLQKSKMLRQSTQFLFSATSNNNIISHNNIISQNNINSNEGMNYIQVNNQVGYSIHSMNQFK